MLKREKEKKILMSNRDILSVNEMKEFKNTDRGKISYL
jgi:hypothetical protein